MVKTLVIDNYDSFTYNLVHLLAIVNQVEPFVLKNDQWTWEEIRQLSFDNVVISPGPGSPDNLLDFGISKEVILKTQVPILGVCLGHQGMASLLGAKVLRAPVPVHGKTATITHTGRGLFAGLPLAFNVARYHSLMVERPLPVELVETAWTKEGILMGFQHCEKPYWGVQFHPESIITEYGYQLIENFRDLTRNTIKSPQAYCLKSTQKTKNNKEKQKRAFWSKYSLQKKDPQDIFITLFENMDNAFWLDGALVDPKISRWSYMGDTNGPRSHLIEYHCDKKDLIITDNKGRRQIQEDIFEYLQEYHCITAHPLLTPPPCPFIGGHVGYLGYELRPEGLPKSKHKAESPDALFFHVDRFIAIDHLEGHIYIIAVDEEHEGDRAEKWIFETAKKIESIKKISTNECINEKPIHFTLNHDKKRYLSEVEQCLEWIKQGESYQLCLTNEITCEASGRMIDLYCTLRRMNPAPFAAFIQWSKGAVLSASPERFLKVEAEGFVETKPIKGTIKRALDPIEDHRLAEILRNSEKDRAENVMIVDLLRNDLAKVCRFGSVVVSKLFDIESFATVHQLVSTIQGILKKECTVIDLICAAFPGGSMTGAPKFRTLELIEQLESRPRGIYSGTLGWIGMDGKADLSIVIRTIVAMNNKLSIGAGGAVVADSTPEGEFSEMQLKLESIISAIKQNHYFKPL